VGGRFITSVPVTPSMDANPYHLHDFTVTTFKQLFLKAGLKEIHSFIQVQPYRIFSIMGRKENRVKDLRKNLIGFYWQYPSKLLCVCYLFSKTVLPTNTWWQFLKGNSLSPDF